MRSPKKRTGRRTALRGVQFRTQRRTAQPLRAAPASWRSTRRRHIPHAAPVALCHGRAVHAERTHATSPAGTARSACEGGRRRAIHRQCQRDRAVAESASRSWVLRDRSGYGRASMGVIGAAVFCLGLSLVGSGSPQKTCLRGSGVRHRLDKALFLPPVVGIYILLEPTPALT